MKGPLLARQERVPSLELVTECTAGQILLLQKTIKEKYKYRTQKQ
jgi:hypothetical protein